MSQQVPPQKHDNKHDHQQHQQHHAAPSAKPTPQTSHPSKDDKKEIGLTATKEGDFSEWYTQLIQKAEIMDYSPVSGCMIIRPDGYAAWENIQKVFDAWIKAKGVKNTYFPLFIPESLMNKEKEHVEGFSPEVAWVTESGKTKLNERLAVRPTSETIMYDSFAKWVRSHRDLPLKINQWCNVVRWEFKHPVPFLRSREFLWQEGHTAFATKAEAEKEVREILDLYEKMYHDYLAVPVLKGKKSEQEKFAGADYTTSVETILPNGKAAQGATSHHLGQHFSKAFGIQFLDQKENKEFAFQNSWGLSTRSIGITLMIHSDNKGAVWPPKIAPTQVVIVPIIFDNSKEPLLKKAKELEQEIAAHARVTLDDREEYTSGWKFNQWEMKGVPLRVELGPKDMEKKQVVIVRRDTAEKKFVSWDDLIPTITQLLDDIHHHLLSKAKAAMQQHIVPATSYAGLVNALHSEKTALVPFCNQPSCEEAIKQDTGGKTLNAPFDQKKSGVCIKCGKEGASMFYMGKSY
ncbi:proline--tRNA ligase [Candidatus Woesearchaeota archaeon]|nr:proline--tRNA ligase [Candidatus Woesearchaeota archaeon]